MKIASISDLHGNLITYPSTYWKGLEECEVLFICGDVLPLDIQFNSVKSFDWLLREFKPWAEALPVEKIFLTAGNHDAFFERHPEGSKSLFPTLEKVTYLPNEYAEYLSTQDSKLYRIFGTPYCHIFGMWPFMRSDEVLKEKYSEIPENIDILFCHDAPYGVSDICYQFYHWDKRHKGCPILRDAILDKKPKYCFHGHLHSANHEEELLGDTKVYNTSILNEDYKITYDPVILEI
jgi:Icc-related predicted phosphoesterase